MPMSAVIVTVVYVDDGEYIMLDIFVIFWTTAVHDGILIIFFVIF